MPCLSPFKLLRRHTISANLVAVTVLIAVASSPARAQTLRLKDGRILSGKLWYTSGVVDLIDASAAETGQAAVRPILIVDDQLRRIFISKLQVAEILEKAPEPVVRFDLWQNPAHGARKLLAVGPSLGVTPFDKYGRRIYEMQTADGILSVVQGITELTPRYAKVEALAGSARAVAWDSRIATSSIPRDMLAKILATAVPQNDVTKRLQVVRFYIQARRFQEARVELARIIEEFPDKRDLQSEEGPLRQLGARALLDEIALRRDAGQHRLAAALLANFPTDGVAGESLVQVRETMAQYEQQAARIERIAATLRRVVAEIEEPDARGLIAPLTEEIIRELSHNTIDRLAPFAQLVDDSSLDAEDKAALAASGWLLGADKAERGLALSLSLVRVRDAVIRYLQEPRAAERQKILDAVISLEGMTAARVAALIAHMKPPRHDARLAATVDGVLDLSAPGQTEDGDFRYQVQLPPEYDPYRRYPTIVALNGAYNTPRQELDFWAGSPPPATEKEPAPPRRGQAMRHGYVVVSIQWRKPHQYQYENSGREHVAVLTSLRDAVRRLAIDTDRVFLTGHDIGGEAAWDIAQAHPDLWAGVIPMVADAGDKYIRHYWSNGQYVPMYFVAGERDGQKMAANANVWDKYLRTPGFDVTLAEYEGRGHEPFHDEIIALFDWMGRKARKFPPAHFDCKTLRPWDNFFWWLECGDFNEFNMMHPADWSSRAARPARVEGRIQNDNRLLAKSPAAETTIWLSPEIVDFAKPIRITYNGRKAPGDGQIAPDVAVLLDDVRTRADRQRPFWAKIEVR